MNREIGRWLVGLLLLWGQASPVMAQQPELQLGVVPYLSATQIAEQFKPLKEHLARSLGRAVGMVTAPNYDTFIERTRQGEYDVIFAPSNLGRLAQKRDGYRVLAQTGSQIAPVVLAREDSSIRSLVDLRGHSIAIGPRVALAYQILDESLRKSKMTLGKDIRIVETPVFSNILQAVVRKEADAGATGAVLWDKAPPEQRKDVVEIFRGQSMPGFLILAHARLGDALIHRLQAALASFKESPGGKIFFQRSQMIDFRPIDEKALKSIDPYVHMLMLAP